eukprot:GHVS01036353.1.p1 GENE.GHVS01036353.1~~GHVS01036353.1.p1  ORF type:complete len:196 (+),score=19.48 GHVS01036353.1:486-1073(+)
MEVRLPIIPSLTELQQASKEVPVPEAKHLYTTEDGLRYHIHTHKLWIPPSYRRTFLFWYHSGAYAGHHGVNRTYKKLKARVWWLHLSRDTEDYVRDCLGCKRNNPPTAAYLRRSLETPLILQTISLDFVGPRRYAGVEYHYAAIIDHGSRFALEHRQFSSPTEERITTLSSKTLCEKSSVVAGLGAPPDIHKGTA